MLRGKSVLRATVSRARKQNITLLHKKKKISEISMKALKLYTVSEKDIVLLHNCSLRNTEVPKWNCCNKNYTEYISVFSTTILWHWILHFLLHKSQILLQARYLYHILILPLHLFFIIQTNHKISHNSFTETYGTEMKVCSWALVIIHTKTILYTWIRERSNENP